MFPAGYVTVTDLRQEQVDGMATWRSSSSALTPYTNVSTTHPHVCTGHCDGHGPEPGSGGRDGGRRDAQGADSGLWRCAQRQNAGQGVRASAGRAAAGAAQRFVWLVLAFRGHRLSCICRQGGQKDRVCRRRCLRALDLHRRVCSHNPCLGCTGTHCNVSNMS